jgi:hypothetical protein
MIKKYFKIVELGNNGEFLTLFHGIGGTRVLPIGEVIKAEIKDNVMDGKGTTYTSGIHVIDGFKNALDYLKRFRRTDRVIVMCEASGLKHKAKSKPYVFLADEITIVDRFYQRTGKMYKNEIYTKSLVV